MSNKVIVPAVSLILVVGVAIGVVAVVHYNNNNGGKTSTHVKAVQSICQNSDDQTLCKDTLAPVDSSDPKEYIKTVVQTSMESVIKVFNLSDRLTVEKGQKDPGVKMALEDCKDLMEFSIDELEASGIMVKDNNLQNVTERTADLKNWLGAVVAYQQSCMDGFDTDGEKKIMEQLNTGGLDNVGKLTGLALDLVSEISEILSSLNLNLNLKPSSRRLLDVDHEDFPHWFSAHDRKLLANLESNKGQVQPNAVVAKDGSGQYKTIQAALAAYPKKNVGRYVIYVKAGVYDEYITIGRKMTNILMYGDGPTKTIVTGSKNFRDGVKTMRSASFATMGDDFIAKSMAFENTAGPGGHQAVALRVQGDRSVFYDCAIHGYQDTLYAHAKRQFYTNCEISGTVDFIFGYSTTLIQNSKIIVRKPDPNQQNIVVADGTQQKNMPTGIVLQNCDIVAEADLIPEKAKFVSYLARPWKAYARTVIMESTIGDFISPEGYLQWAGTQNHQTCYFAEYNNVGAGASVAKRVKWGGTKGLISKAEAARFTAGQWLQAYTWLPATGIPFVEGFIKP